MAALTMAVLTMAVLTLALARGDNKVTCAHQPVAHRLCYCVARPFRLSVGRGTRLVQVRVKVRVRVRVRVRVGVRVRIRVRVGARARAGGRVMGAALALCSAPISSRDRARSHTHAAPSHPVMQPAGIASEGVVDSGPEAPGGG